MTDLMQKFASLKGSKFVGINGYTSSKTGEVSNQVINMNVNIERAKKKDLETLKNYPAFKLNEIAKKVGASKEVALQAIEEMIVSGERNLTTDNRTNQSKGQTKAYTQLGKGVKFHNATGEIFISGFANNKTVLVEGVYPKVNSSAKTLVKKEVNKTLRMYKFRNFRLNDIVQNITVTGSTVQIR